MTPQQPQPQLQQPFDQLTDREREVMELYSNPYYRKVEICEALDISMNTLNSHILSAFSKLGETDRFTAAWRFWELYPDSYDKIKRVNKRKVA